MLDIKEGNAREGRGTIRGTGKNMKAKGASNPESCLRYFMDTWHPCHMYFFAPCHSCK